MTNVYSENYLRNQIESSSKEQLLIMFYDGAIRFVTRAENAIRDNNIEQRSHCINKASAIIAELSATLDHEIGGERRKTPGTGRACGMCGCNGV